MSQQQQQQQQQQQSIQPPPPPPPPAAAVVVSSSSCTTTKLLAFCKEHEFVLLILCAIGIAKYNPSFGLQYCYPKITATYIAVIVIFIISGLSLQTKELHIAAFHNINFNIYIQCYNFFGVSLFVYSICYTILYPLHIITNIHLINGMIICSCLPMAINTVIVITKSSHGNDAAAIFNCAFANLMGVIISPILILYYLGISSHMNIIDVFIKLALRVLLPVFIGQLLQRLLYVQTYIIIPYKHLFKNIQQYCLVFIVYTVFCSTFMTSPSSTDNDNNNSSITVSTNNNSNMLLSTHDVIMVFICQIILLLCVMIFAWITLRTFFHNQPQLQVMGFVGCTFKTVAVGVPLINAMYATTSPELVALYTLPLLIWHPMQLIIGSLLAPYMAKYVDTELIRIASQQQEAAVVEAVVADHHTNGNTNTSMTTTIDETSSLLSSVSQKV